MLYSDESFVIGVVFLGCLIDIYGHDRTEREDLLEI